MCFPNLIIPGAGKSGTSSLHLYLNQHPDIYMSEKKEPGYFFYDHLYKKQANWYQGLFEEGKSLKYRGESSTYYFKYELALKRMKEDLVDPKFIILLRHPIERIISHYFWIWGKGMEYRSFRRAVKSDMYDEFTPVRHIRQHYKFYIQNSFYANWIKKYFKYFGRENVKVITTEMLKEKPLDVMNDCFEFLGLEKLQQIENTKHNVTVHRKVPYWDRLMMQLIFAENPNKRFHKIKERLLPEIFVRFYWKFHNKISPVILHPPKPKISEEDYKWLKNLLQDDIKELKRLINNPLNEWSDLKKI